jgi:hypothetical protein
MPISKTAIATNMTPAGHLDVHGRSCLIFDDISITYHESIPSSLGGELDILYGHVNSSLCHFHVKARAHDACAYVARRGGRPLAIFLLRHEGNTIRVINEMIQVDAEEIERFSRYMFGRFPSVARISFSLIGARFGNLSLPFQQHGHSEDIVISLPATPEAYHASLSRKMRQNIKQRQNGIMRDYPALQIRTFEGSGIVTEYIYDLIRLKKMNMEEKKNRFGLTEDEIAWTVERARKGGLLTVAMLEGRVCGGSLSLRLGDHYFAQLIAYDPKFRRHGLGTLCCYLTIREKILRKAKETHLGWGRNPYKFDLLGVQRNMANLDLYRSRFRYLQFSGTVLKNAATTTAQELKIYLLSCEQSARGPARFIGKFVSLARQIKRARFDMAG